MSETMATAVVTTSGGKLRGSAANGVLAFLGIPYAASTASTRRFLPPGPPVPWSGIREAGQYAGHAPQASSWSRLRPELENFAGPPDMVPQSEDCLTVNVWTPDVSKSGSDGGRRPVMVWLHGGAFSWGSGNRPMSDGGNLAKRGDLVVVSVNHRLNILGHLHLGGVTDDPDFAQSGNAGVLDLLAALRWVRENISAFGGDPDCVTIFGESGGGGKVSTLLAMPAARGLFHRAIIQSGATVRLIEPDRATQLADAVLRLVGLGRNDIARLQQLPVATLLGVIDQAEAAIPRTATPLFDRYNFGPVMDGSLIPQHPFDPAAAILADIPLLIGDTAQEASYFNMTDDKVWHRTLTEDELRARVGAVAGPHTDRVIATYRETMPGATPADRLIATLTDSNFRIRSFTVAQRRAALNRGQVYMYNFRWPSPAGGGGLARRMCWTCRSPSIISIASAPPTATPRHFCLPPGCRPPGRSSPAPATRTIRPFLPGRRIRPRPGKPCCWMPSGVSRPTRMPRRAQCGKTSPTQPTRMGLLSIDEASPL